LCWVTGCWSYSHDLHYFDDSDGYARGLHQSDETCVGGRGVRDDRSYSSLYAGCVVASIWVRRDYCGCRRVDYLKQSVNYYLGSIEYINYRIKYQNHYDKQKGHYNDQQDNNIDHQNFFYDTSTP
jgi:hypothetical protein